MDKLKSYKAGTEEGFGDMGNLFNLSKIGKTGKEEGVSNFHFYQVVANIIHCIREKDKRYWERFSDLVTQLIISD